MNGRRIAAAIFTLLLLATPALAQRNPFAVGANEGAAGAGTGIVGWILAEQGRFYKALTGAVREAKSGAAGFWLLAGLSFAYGVFHAAGPGHGKAVMASYMIANERALKRGLILTFLAAMLQGAVAIAIVGIAALIFNATARRMTEAAQAIELVSYGAVAALGMWLVWTKGRAFVREARALSLQPALATANGAGLGSPSRFVCDAVEPGHVHTADCGHFHAPDPATLDRDFSWGSALATIGLTIPVVAALSVVLGFPLVLGLPGKEMVLLALTLIVSVLTLGSGRATVLQGTVHLVMFAVFLFLAVVP